MSDIFLNDLEIGHAAHRGGRGIGRIAAEHLEPYGRYIAKVAPTAPAALSDRAPTKYIVITAVTPTHLGEGKTTLSIGLAQGLALLGHKSMLSPRQPSLGPTFGIKGGAAGAGCRFDLTSGQCPAPPTGSRSPRSSACSTLPR